MKPIMLITDHQPTCFSKVGFNSPHQFVINDDDQVSNFDFD